MYGITSKLDIEMDSFVLGSGTMFLRPEKIQKHHSMATVDIEKLKDLLIKYVMLTF